MPVAKAPKRPKASPEAQHAKFVEAAKRLGTDDDPKRFKDTVKKLAKAKPDVGASSTAKSQHS